MTEVVYFVHKSYTYQKKWVEHSTSHPKQDYFKGLFYIKLNRTFIEHHLNQSYLCLLILGETDIHKSKQNESIDTKGQQYYEGGLVVQIENSEFTLEAMLYVQELFGDTTSDIPQISSIQLNEILHFLPTDTKKEQNEKIQTLARTLVQYIGISPYHLWLYYNIPTGDFKNRYRIYVNRTSKRKSGCWASKNQGEDKDGKKSMRIVNHPFSVIDMLDPTFVATITDLACEYKDPGIVTLWNSNFEVISKLYRTIGHLDRFEINNYIYEPAEYKDRYIARMKSFVPDNINFIQKLIQCETSQFQNIHQFIQVISKALNTVTEFETLYSIYISVWKHTIQYFEPMQLDKLKTITQDYLHLTPEACFEIYQMLWVYVCTTNKWNNQRWLETELAALNTSTSKSNSKSNSKSKKRSFDIVQPGYTESDGEKKRKLTHHQEIVKTYDDDDFIYSYDKSHRPNIRIIKSLSEGIKTSMLYEWIWNAIKEKQIESIQHFMTQYSGFDFIHNKEFFVQKCVKQKYAGIKARAEVPKNKNFWDHVHIQLNKNTYFIVPDDVWTWNDHFFAKQYGSELLMYAYLAYDYSLMSIFLPHIKDPIQTYKDLIINISELTVTNYIFVEYSLLNAYFIRFNSSFQWNQIPIVDPYFIQDLILHLNDKSNNNILIATLYHMIEQSVYTKETMVEEFKKQNKEIPTSLSLLFNHI